MPSRSRDRSRSRSPGYFVFLRGLPWSTNDKELKHFFGECAEGIVKILLTANSQGKPSGEGFVEFSNEEDFEAALAKDRNYIGSRYVEVVRSCRADMQTALRKSERFSNRPREREPVAIGSYAFNNNPVTIYMARLRGLPFGVSKEEIGYFLKGCDILPNGIALLLERSGKQSGDAFVQFANRQSLEKALDKHREKIGHRYIEIFRSSETELQQFLQRYVIDQQAMYPPYMGSGSAIMSEIGGPMVPLDCGMGPIRGGSRDRYRSGPYDRYPSSTIGSVSSGLRSAGPSRDEGGHFVYCRGLPYNTTEREMREFFLPVLVRNVMMGFDKSSKPNGEANVEFYNHSDAVEAMKRNGHYIGSRYVELVLNSR